MFVKRTWLGWIAAIAVAVTFLLPAPALALTMRQGSNVTVASGESLADDLYAFGNTITIDGNVDGDVVAFGQIVVINGDVSGSVITAAQTVRIDGNVGGSVRAAGATVDVNGTVDGDVLAGANQVTVGGTIQRDLAAGAQDVAIPGVVRRDVMTGSSTLLIAGPVGGDVRAQTPAVTVADSGSVAGSLDYWSDQPATIRGPVEGPVRRHEPPANQRGASDGSRAAGGSVAGAIIGAILVWIQAFLGFVLLGLFMVFALRRPTQGASQAFIDRFGASFGVGALVFFAAPMLALFIFVVGLFLGVWWLAFVLLTVFWLLLLAGLVVGSLALGRAILAKAWAGREPALAWSMLLGLLLVWLASAVPFLGALAMWVVTTAGTGALILLWLRKAEKPAPPMVAEPLAPTAPAPPPAPAPASPPAPAPAAPTAPPTAP